MDCSELLRLVAEEALDAHIEVLKGLAALRDPERVQHVAQRLEIFRTLEMTPSTFNLSSLVNLLLGLPLHCPA